MNLIFEAISSANQDAAAIGAPDRMPLTYGGLGQLIENTCADLNRFGIGRNDRVAIVLPNGPEMATAFLSVAACTTSAPLNPAYKKDEFAFYLSDLHAKAVIVEAGSTSPALEAATDLDIPILTIDWQADDPAGSFAFAPSDLSGQPGHAGLCEDEDVALVLHTSGTTSRPKVVPLTTGNIMASADHIRETLHLINSDVGLNIMPLFHIHGLIASLLSSMTAGAEVVCTPGFNALKFFNWLDAVKPSWYTAVPTMHQAILARAGRNTEIVRASKLRFARSSSSSLPPPVMAELEALFDCPVIEAYGMTEAAHQMASNPLPPAARKAGTVGRSAGPEIAIMDEAGTVKGLNESGEIVIRGPNVTAGYENNPEANASAFTDGWFRTGDLGFLDDDGYLTISGRLKEIINRGGEKIAPREVDDVIQAHPAVDQVVTFAMPHDKLGEAVAAVVVLKEGAHAEVSDIKAFAAERLAAFKVPSTILIRDEIPKGATGKLQRIGLAEKLGL
ncbi:MAG: acyl--CoA ligase [Alphaproteobacteria bacterium]|nr:acyl--CoA ligase [Alphaproteobacteria bacterium]